MPEPTATMAFTASLPASVWARLEVIAAARNITVDEVVAHAVELLLKPQKVAPTQKGQSGGTAPYGYSWAGSVLEPVEAEQAVIRSICEAYAGGASLRAVAATLNRCEMTRRGALWRAESVRRVLRRAGVMPAPAVVSVRPADTHSRHPRKDSQ